MISKVTAMTMGILVFVILVFILTNLKNAKKYLMYRIYLLICVCLSVWLLALIGMYFTDPHNQSLLFVLDSITYIGVCFVPVLGLYIAFIFIHHYETLPYRYYWFLVVPILTQIIVWTNPWHHLQYQQFSIIRSELVFGPYMIFGGSYGFICLILSCYIIISGVVKSDSKAYYKHAILFVVGIIVPLVTNVLATLNIGAFSIASTPMSFVVTVILHGIAINKLNFLRLTPIAINYVMNSISDCYLILSDNHLILKYNEPFHKLFALPYGMKESHYLEDCLSEGHRQMDNMIYNLMGAIDSCRETKSKIVYEQSCVLDAKQYYFMIDVTPLLRNDYIIGYVAFYKDITGLKISMQKVQKSQQRLAQQERLASLGQMIGGISHNFKTPIMSIAGSLSAMRRLVDEATESLDDQEVTKEDYLEMFEEMLEWIERSEGSCAYMSDIISAVKGQATNMNASNAAMFTVENLIKTALLLMKHELDVHQCELDIQNEVPWYVCIAGDINNLVQVMNNLLNNAIDAQCQKDKKKIILRAYIEEEQLVISVEDFGDGVSKMVADKLFKEMITDKGIQGTGIGLYMSQVMIAGKFGGTMWFRNKENHAGAIFGFTISYESLSDEHEEDNNED